MLLDEAAKLVLGGVGDVVAERLGEELVGGGQVLLAVPEQHAGPVVEGGTGRFGHQGGLAQAGLTRDEEDLPPFAGGHPLGASANVSSAPGRPRPRAGRAASRRRQRDGIRRPVAVEGSQSTSTVAPGRAGPSA